MWVRQCELDVRREAGFPIPARIASNEEFIPPPQSSQQKEFACVLHSLADVTSRMQHVDRPTFLRSGSGMATALAALNEVFGNCYCVKPDELREPGAFEEHWQKEQFILDMQTHHVGLGRRWFEEAEDGRRTRRLFGEAGEDLQTWNRLQYVKEIFGNSDTCVAVLSGAPVGSRDLSLPDQMARTREFVNDLAGGSRRILSHGIIQPHLGEWGLDEMERQAAELRVDSWRCWTGPNFGDQPWRLDDEAVAYPFWQKARELGVRVICVHKGLPLSPENEEGCRVDDVEKAAKDFPDLNFVIYHSGFRGFRSCAKACPQPEVATHDNPQEIPWTSDILRMLKRNAAIRNVYLELGSTFHQTSMYCPTLCMHMLGQMLQTVGAERILWGTDSMWSGGPQSQIDRFRRLKIHDKLIEQFGYPQLTLDAKDQILGLNAARLYGIDPKAAMSAIKADRLSAMRREHHDDLLPSNTQFGWVWEGANEPTVPIGV